MYDSHIDGSVITMMNQCKQVSQFIYTDKQLK